MNGHDRFADVVGRHDVDAVARLERKNRQALQHAEGLHHVELRRFGPRAVSEDDRGTENTAVYLGKELVDHVFAEFLGTSVRVVVGARPVDGRVFLDDFVLAVAGDGDRRDVREAPQAVMILSSPGELNDFESASEIYIEAL